MARPTILRRWLAIFEPCMTHRTLGARVRCSARQAGAYVRGHAVPGPSVRRRLVAFTLLPASVFSATSQVARLAHQPLCMKGCGS